MAIRGFSNEITARGLADHLGVSYSTLARCKSGNWPRSITLDAVRDTFEECRERYFDGDGEAMARSVIIKLGSDGVDPRGLKHVLDQQGYDAFMATLLMAAKQQGSEFDGLLTLGESGAVDAGALEQDGKSYESSVSVAASAGETGAAGVGEAVAPSTDRVVIPGVGEAGASGSTGSVEAAAGGIGWHVHNAAMAVPVALLLVVGMSGLSVSSMVTWASMHRMVFFAISIAIAVLPAIVGIAVDSPIAWRRWRRANPDATPTPRDLALIAKFGGADRLVPLEGRFNLTLPYLAFQPVCNLLSMMCYVSLLAFLLTLPGFLEFITVHEFVEFFKVGAAVSYYIAYQFMREQYARPFVGEFGLGICENPDNYLPSRFHMWANVVHLVWTGSALIVLLLGLVAYSISNFRQVGAPMLMLWPFLQLVLYFAFSSASPYAVRIQASGAGVMVPGIVVSSVGFSALALVCYLPSAGGAALCAAGVVCSALALAWARRIRGGELADWLDQSRASFYYPAVFVATIAVLLAVGMATLAFA